MTTESSSFKKTVRELAATKDNVEFFRELIDTTSVKCYGIQLLTAEEVKQDLDRFVGFYGQRVRTFTAPFDMQRGHKIVTINASKKKPITCWEHVYAHV